MRLAVGITTILALEPPETRMKRSRMRRSFSLFSAPPIGTIQPRVSPGGILLGIQHSRYWRLCRSLPGDSAAVLSVANYLKTVGYAHGAHQARNDQERRRIE